MATMPNLIGLELAAAEKALETAGILVPASLGYFSAWPITVTWIASTSPPTVITAQSPAAAATVAANASVTLTASQPPISVAYPGSNWSAF